MYSRDKSKERRAEHHEMLAQRAGEFLTRVYKEAGFSRKEAAGRAGVSEGYLTGLLAGRIANPGIEIIDRMAAHWGFDKLDFYKHVGVLTSKDIDDHCAKKERGHLPADVDMVLSRLQAMPVQQRQEISETLLKMIDVVQRR